MIEAIGAVGQSTTIESVATRATQGFDPPILAFQQPTGAEVADFARAVATGPVAEATATPPPGSDGLAMRLAQQADALSAQLQTLGQPPVNSSALNSDSSAHATTGVATGRDQLNEAVAQIERAYMFAIETTLASRGSTETTKIFNTLLKGQ